MKKTDKKESKEDLTLISHIILKERDRRFTNKFDDKMEELAKKSGKQFSYESKKEHWEWQEWRDAQRFKDRAEYKKECSRAKRIKKSIKEAKKTQKGQ